jgi:hypothetical protein
MTDGVLDERLQHEGGHARVHRPRVELVAHGERLAEARALHLHVCVEHREIVAQRHLRVGQVPARRAQQAGELAQHARGQRRLLARELRGDVERVEQEVRLQLPLQELEPRPRQPRLERQRTPGARHEVALRIDRHRRGDHQRVDETW